VDYSSALNETRTDTEQRETPADFRVSYESRRYRRFNAARQDGPAVQGRHLYFIQIAKGRSPVKIGRANDPVARLAALQVASPYELKLLGTLNECGDYELEFHAFLGRDRMRGEWFRWSKPVEETVKLALAGGDWREAISRRRNDSEDAWWDGSPLYATIVQKGQSHG
jgi:hypothetical protein